MKKLFKFIGLFLFWIAAIICHIWSAGVIFFCAFSSTSGVGKPLAIAYGGVIALVVLFPKKRTRNLLLSLVAFLGIVIWFSLIKINPDAVYPQQLTMPYADINGDQVTIYNVRNNDYFSVDDFDVRYETRTYDLNQLQTVDMCVNYWGMDLVAHAFLSFGFANGDYISVSIEIRPEIGESYGMLDGFYKQYEIIYIWADERDLVRLRTNYRKEDAYLYRMALSSDKVRKIFLSMIERTNSLYETPQFYNTMMESCTNTIGDHVVKTGILDVPVWKRRFLSGTVDKRSYDEGWIVNTRPFSELRQASYINERAQTADSDIRFSDRIRTHFNK